MCYTSNHSTYLKYMKKIHKIALILSIIVLFGALSLNADAAKKTLLKPTKKATVQIIKKPVAVKPTVIKTAPKTTKKQTTSAEKKPVASKPIVAPVPKPTATTTSATASSFPWHDNILATQFYIGETGLNGTTAWDCHAVNHYGGIDSPFNRNGYLPVFQPKENPFYLALPYTDIGDAGTHKTDIPWYDTKLDTGAGYSFIKNKWVQVKRGDKVCYGQWEDSLTPDILDPITGKRTGYAKPIYFDYVFGTAPATHPGIDISPALSDCLGMRDSTDTQFGHADGLVSWRFVKDTEVADGAWKTVITTTPVSWENCQ